VLEWACCTIGALLAVSYNFMAARVGIRVKQEGISTNSEFYASS